MVPSISIIIPTRNRADSLRKTLTRLGAVNRPKNWILETVVVDNGSSDHTEEAVRASDPGMPVRYVFEARPGISVARNAGMAAAAGDVFLWIDDDLKPPVDWIEAMCGPLIAGDFDAVAGGVALAESLERPWMNLWHRAWLASTECLDSANPGRMVGANMAFLRSATQAVPAFDPELGAGALGMADETLYAMQLKQAGLSIGSALHVVCEHHCEENRLTREAFLGTAAKLGRSEAYIAHHWEHRAIPSPHAALARARLRYAAYALKMAGRKTGAPAEVWEMQLLKDIHFYRHFIVESARPRNYSRFGNRRLDFAPAAEKGPAEARTPVNAN